ncbi:MAG: hypothetical protein ACFE9L_16115 [Candidatus Hodarchaeota archaeon]
MSNPLISLREYFLQELWAIKTRIEANQGRTTQFFCQLDQETYPVTQNAYQCLQCTRYICTRCYDELVIVRMVVCPFCKGTLKKVISNIKPHSRIVYEYSCRE